MSDQLTSVTVGSVVSGVVPVAFVAVVEVVDVDGVRRFETVISDGLTDERRAVLVDAMGLRP